MRYEPADAALFVRNRARLAALLPPGAMVVIHANDIYPTNADGIMPFKQNANLYYLSGIDQEDTTLILFPSATEEKDRAILFVRETTERLRIWEGEKLTLEQAHNLSGVECVKLTTTFEADFQRLALQAESLFLETNEHPRAEASAPTRNDRFIAECKAKFPLHQYGRLAPLMAQLRAIKAPEEIAMQRHAIDITEAGFRRVFDFLQPGVGEWEVEAEFTHEFLRRRSRGFAYSPIVASGANALCLHYVGNEQRCGDGELVLMDIGAEWGNWNADLTRTVPANGRFTPRQRAVYDAVLRVFRFADKTLRPGALIKDYTIEVYNCMAEELAQLGLLSAEDLKHRTPEKDPVRQYFMHGVSHPLGLDVHDVYPSNAPIAEGMVFTIEPGIYITEEGLGIRLENNFLVGKNGNEDLCAKVPLEAEEIEEAMKR
ncbi:aminopeptidase P family protein [Cerasicoccus arenae]|uniref:Xaa-Pro aminopeptidase n=1 Tax=Cerasicoccus arenae TaxID=424488 RepID=A0A8J3DGU9_9BACT|nr:aminopeptidase P family protein [Cerasicoccus arenae]MBK1858000.1 aminopeptidase P N-terminal domain-containing protein [Cerasicoccus arenae]GHB97548.1 Xaa-Pro aminopeptidase [Cerasicoccus arenae]